jgi:hypothetical protein
MALNDTYIDNGIKPIVVLQMISITIYSPTRKQQMFIFDTFFFTHLRRIFNVCRNTIIQKRIVLFFERWKHR